MNQCVRHTIPWMHSEKSGLAKRELPGQVIQSQAWQSKTIARAMVSNCNVGVAMTYGTHCTLPVLSCCCVVNIVCCDLPASTDQRARGTFVQTFWVQSNTFAGWALTEVRHTIAIPTCSACPNESMCTSYDTVDALRKVRLSKARIARAGHSKPGMAKQDNC